MTCPLLKWAHLTGPAILFGSRLGIAFFAWFGDRFAPGRQAFLGVMGLFAPRFTRRHFR